MRKFTLFILVSLFLFGAKLSFCQFTPGYFALKDVHVIDGVSKAVLEHQTIIIRKNRIEKIGPAKQIIIPDSCVIFAYSGKYVIPGLIDTHIHLATDPSTVDTRARAETDLRLMLRSGITSVRDMAGDARALASLARDAKLGDMVAPDIYYSALMAGPSFFSDSRTHQSSRGGLPGQMPYMRAVTDSTNLPLAIAEAKGTGASAIKLYAQLSGALAQKITTEAHRQGMLVWSHADLTIASPLEVINAGVNSISHAGMITRWPTKQIPGEWLKPGLSETFWDSVFKTLPVEEYIRGMLAHKTILDATLFIYKSDLTDTSLSDIARARAIASWQIGKRFTQLALARGVPVCTGTDTDQEKFVQREIKLLVKACGFTPMEALISATRHGAMAIGIDATTGTIQSGKVADLVILSANPATNIDHLDEVDVVIKHGILFNIK